MDIPGAIEAWRSGAFTLAGRPPKGRLIDDFEGGGGRTFYVGSREGGKLCRVYEKGKQLGDPESKWVRAEVELHAKDRVIPWDAITDPVKYLAGAYSYFAYFSLEAERIRTIRRGTEVSIGAAQAWMKNAAGKTVNVLLDHFDGDYAALVEAVRRDGIPKRLKGWWGAAARLLGKKEA